MMDGQHELGNMSAAAAGTVCLHWPIDMCDDCLQMLFCEYPFERQTDTTDEIHRCAMFSLP